MPHVQLSSVQNPGWLLYIEDEILPSDIEIIMGHEIRIPINQPGFNGMSAKGFVAAAQLNVELINHLPHPFLCFSKDVSQPKLPLFPSHTKCWYFCKGETDSEILGSQ